MITVDPSGLAAAAQRIVAALAEVSGTSTAHPPLAADPAAVGAATRLSTAASTLAATLGVQAAGLAATAEQLVNVATGFAAADQTNATKIAALNAASDGPAVTGGAPPAPPVAPDARPPLSPPPAVPPETIAAAVHSGDPAGGEPFAAAWSQVALTAKDAAAAIRSVADHLPDVWESPQSTEVVRTHLLRYAEGFDTSGSRAQTLADQAGQHGEQQTQARRDIPSPQTYAEVRHQRDVVAQANIASGGRYSAQLAALNNQLAELDSQTLHGYSTFHTATDATTAGEVDLDGDGIPDVPGEAAPGQPGSEQGVSPEMAGQLASMLPQMIPAVLGAAGGLLGGAVSTVGKAPEGLMQAVSQAAGAATQNLSQMSGKSTGLGGDIEGVEGIDGLESEDIGAGGGGGGGVGSTTPAAGGTPLMPVTPSTGAAPAPPTMPAGGLPSPAAPSTGGGPGMGMMPMGMPLAGMAGAAGGQGGGGDERTAHPKKLVTPPAPHTESVTGKVTQDRTAMSATAPKDDPPDDGGQSQQSVKPVVRRITMPPPRDDE